MKLLTLGAAALAVSAFAIAPAHACSWGKTASKDKNMTVATTDQLQSTADTDVAIATNDVSDGLLKSLQPATESKPAE
ncbi:hypothetical protein E1180_01850 [Roseibium denhamense]|uniref:DUF680 domain-containing protein n=1 Tax=Roseibium denhamense TaxID=76305 RepID=A0ABY1PNR9_9HYPH|nr:hypothetical protein [Roseibium denhamense]MTI04259.1 hypothetical protein [Roseibium denhamense]SMP37312.1 hypothetical protein SAMN06265374_0057 [Roseibium denhamense]